MATITIPSPSAYLESPIIQPAPIPKVSVKASPKKPPSSAKTQKKSTTRGDAAITKPKQTKSRDGCKNCKEKRLKCDETKPTCVQCEKKGVLCKGYEKVLKWRPQEDAFTVKTGLPKPRKNSTGSKVPRRSPTTSRALDESSQIHDASTPSVPYHRTVHPPSLPLDPRLAIHVEAYDDDSPPPRYQHVEDDHQGMQPMQTLPQDDIPSSTPSLINGGYDENNTPHSARTMESHNWPNHTPRMAGFVLSGTGLNNAPVEEADNHFGQSLGPRMSHELPNVDDFPSYEDNDVEEIIRGQDHAKSWMLPMGSPTTSDSSWSSGGSWIDAIAATVRGQPLLHPGSEEMLMMRFDKETCGILSIKDGPTENPWRTILWPLAREEGALRHAITSLTAFHAAKERPCLRIKGVEHMTQSLQLLSHGLDSMPLTTSLATTLVLAFCESWDMLVSTGIQHLRGARNLVGKILANHRLGRTFPGSEPFLGFLCRTWVYMDVIARLTSLDGDDSTDFDIVSTPLCRPSVINQDVDPLMGCASTLFPIIGRVANLVREVRQRSQGNSYQIISQAKNLKSQLEKWSAPLVFEAPEDQRTEVEQGLWTAEAYRGATLLYLLQTVPEISYDSVTENIKALAKGVLTNVANVPVTSGMVIIHIFPLLAAGCEAVDQESRTFVRERWQEMMRRMNIQNLDRCLDVVEEVWQRRDDADLEKQRRKAQLAASKCLTGYMPATIMKRKLSIDVIGDSNQPSDAKRMAIQSTRDACSAKPSTFRRESTTSTSGLEYEYTVRGPLHWAGVMKDLRWEILIG